MPSNLIFEKDRKDKERDKCTQFQGEFIHAVDIRFARPIKTWKIRADLFDG